MTKKATVYTRYDAQLFCQSLADGEIGEMSLRGYNCIMENIKVDNKTRFVSPEEMVTLAHALENTTTCGTCHYWTPYQTPHHGRCRAPIPEDIDCGLELRTTSEYTCENWKQK